MQTSAADIEQQAAEWLVRRDADSWSEADEAAFNQWIDDSTSHRIAVIRLDSVWRKSARLRIPASGTSIDLPVEPTEQAPSAERAADATKWWIRPWLIAASLLLLLLPGQDQQSGPLTYETEVGGYRQVSLSDGSRIEINTNTDLAVNYSQDERRIRLSKGEAFFKVVKDANRPFVVHFGDFRAVAVGTAFTVRTRGQDMEVVVTEGTVRLDGSYRNGKAMRPVFVSAGQAVTTSAPSRIGDAPADKLEAVSAWRDGTLIFESKSLNAVADEFNRYNHVQLIVDASAAEVVIDGSFRSDNVDGFVRLIESGFGLTVVREGADKIVLAKK